MKHLTAIIILLLTVNLFAQITSKKIDENTIQISKSTVSTINTVKYDYDFLVEQRARIVADLLAYTIARQKEIDELDVLLLECKKLGIVGKPKPIK
ncbi:hypothetical protein M1146_07745 [Patescibacteria group bacterium]|nr:hypothetical protein [Patescibacteria group bacterium]